MATICVQAPIFAMILIMLRMELGPDRLCFGSDMPFGLTHVQLAMYRALLRDHDAAAQAQVLGGNLGRVLRLAI